MMNKKKILLFLLLTVLLLTLVTTVYAYMFREIKNVTSIFVPANVDCSVQETFTGSEKNSIMIINESNVDAYVRVRFVCYWQDSKGNPIVSDIDQAEFTLGKDWLEYQNVYYYKYTLAPNEQTKELLGSKITMPDPICETISSDGVVTEYWYYPVVEVFAEAIQALPTNAVVESWGVTLDENGNITALNGGN